MTSKFEYIKFVVTNWKTIVAIITFLLSLNVYQFDDREDKAIQNAAMSETITYYAVNYVVPATNKKKPIKHTSKTIIQKCDCLSIVKKEIAKHLRREH